MQNIYLVICSGHIDNYHEIKSRLSNTLNLTTYKTIAVDGGLRHCREMDISPDYAIGDFDSANIKDIEYYKNHNCQFHQYPTDKNKTDTEIAFDYCNNNSADMTVVIGFSGKRIDHTIANLNISTRYLNNNEIIFLDENNIVRILNGNLEFSTTPNTYCSILPLTDKIFINEISGLKYKISKKYLYRNSSLSISNLTTSEIVNISSSEGYALVILSND